MSHDLAPLIAACATWLDRAYGCRDTPLLAAMAQVQARQAVTVAAWLRYPTEVDAALVHLVGPGGARGLDAAVGLVEPGREPWRSWVDETVVSWGACLLADAELAQTAARAVADTDHARGLHVCFRSLLEPDDREARAARLLRHPDLLDSVARLHRGELSARLNG